MGWAGFEFALIRVIRVKSCPLFPIRVYSCSLVVKNKKPTAVWQWVDKFRERIKTRLPRWSAARS
jgi:hypothetical protein